MSEDAGYIIARLVDLVAVTICALVRIIRVQAVAAEACSSGWTWLVFGSSSRGTQRFVDA